MGRCRTVKGWPGIALLLVSLFAAPACIAEDPEHPFKLSVGAYSFSDQAPAEDVNLRYTSSAGGHFWLGDFRQPVQGIQQWRSGWDQSFGDQIRISPSLQFAQGGFVGGSLNLETGPDWFVGAGLGRTNLQPYYNLNFDPNDSYTLSAGWRRPSGAQTALQWIQDNRLNPDQRHLHAVHQQDLRAGQRFTMDILYKQGRVNGEMIHRLGATLTYEWPRYFLRLAFDPKTNFTPADALRLSVGVRL